jgi:hypothetical protein
VQNRYVADIGDYVKFAILRALSPGRRLGVVCWLFADEDHNADGGHREYLDRHSEWKHFDPPLFEALLKIEREKKHDVRAIEDSSVLPNAVFVSDPIPCKAQPYSLRPEERKKWIEAAKTTVKNCNLVFLDPDNGIASERLKLTKARAGKSVTIDDIKSLQEGNRTIVVYHHQTRLKGGHLFEIVNLFTRLRKSGVHVSGALRATPWSPRAFFVLNGDEELQDRSKALANLWGKHVSWHSENELLKNSESHSMG